MLAYVLHIGVEEAKVMATKELTLWEVGSESCLEGLDIITTNKSTPLKVGLVHCQEGQAIAAKKLMPREASPTHLRE